MKHRTGRILPQVLESLFKKPATVSYPENRRDVFTNIRGKLTFDASKCVGCRLCVRDCPARALEIEKVGDKQFQAILKIDQCVFCGQCVDSCNKDALECTSEFELAGLSRRDMKANI